jgi:hypothetical protein
MYPNHLKVICFHIVEVINATISPKPKKIEREYVELGKPPFIPNSTDQAKSALRIRIQCDDSPARSPKKTKLGQQNNDEDLVFVPSPVLERRPSFSEADVDTLLAKVVQRQKSPMLQSSSQSKSFIKLRVSDESVGGSDDLKPTKPISLKLRLQKPKGMIITSQENSKTKVPKSIDQNIKNLIDSTESKEPGSPLKRPIIVIPHQKENLTKEIFDDSDSDLTPTSELHFFDAPPEILSPRNEPSFVEKVKKSKQDISRQPTNPFVKRCGPLEVIDGELLQDLEILRMALPKKDANINPIIPKSKRRTKLARSSGSPPRNVIVFNQGSG